MYMSLNAKSATTNELQQKKNNVENWWFKIGQIFNNYKYKTPVTNNKSNFKYW